MTSNHLISNIYTHLETHRCWCTIYVTINRYIGMHVCLCLYKTLIKWCNLYNSAKVFVDELFL